MFGIYIVELYGAVGSINFCWRFFGSIFFCFVWILHFSFFFQLWNEKQNERDTKNESVRACAGMRKKRNKLLYITVSSSACYFLLFVLCCCCCCCCCNIEMFGIERTNNTNNTNNTTTITNNNIYIYLLNLSICLSIPNATNTNQQQHNNNNNNTSKHDATAPLCSAVLDICSP